MEQIDYNLLFRWFVGLSIDDAVWDASVFTENRDRLLEADVAREFLAILLALPKVKRLLSSDHFSVDGTLLDAWASMKSFPAQGWQRRAARRWSQRRAQLPPREAVERDACEHDRSRRQPPSQGRRKESRLCYMGHVLMENRHGLAVSGDVTRASGTAERKTALDHIDRHRLGRRRITAGGERGFDVEGFVHALHEREVTPHIAIDGHLSKTGKPRRTAIDRRTLRHPGYNISQRCRKRVEEVFGWIKTTGGLTKLKVRGLAKVQAVFTFAIIAYNLVRIPKLTGGIHCRKISSGVEFTHNLLE